MAKLTLAVANTDQYTTHDLTALGSADWLAWPSSATPERRASGSGLVYSWLNGANELQAPNVEGAPTMTWTDGASVVSGLSRGLLYTTGGPGKVFRITAPAGTVAKTIRFILSSYVNTITVEASLSDGSVATLTDSSLVHVGGDPFRRLYTLEYAAASEGQTLTVDFSKNNAGSHFGVYGIALNNGAPPKGAVTSQPAPDGQNLTVSFSTENQPTGGSAVLNLEGGGTFGGVLNLTNDAGTATFTGIPPGVHTLVITLTSPGGSSTVTGVQPVTILGISGEPEAPGAASDTTAPAITAAAVASASPGVVVLTSSEPLDTASVPAASAFAVSGHTVQSVSIAGSAINLTVTPVFANGEAPRTVGYTVPGTNPVRDLASTPNGMAAFSGVAITNNVAAPVSTVTGVTINPTAATVAGGATQAFTATAQGTNSPAQTFTWTRNPAVGTISGNGTATGSFTVPAATNEAQTIEVTATSTQDPNYSAKATVTVPAAAPAGTSFTRSLARTIRVKPAPQMFEGGPFWNTTSKTRPVGTIDVNETIDVSFDLTDVLADIADTVKKIDFDLAGLTSVGGYFTGSVATVFVSNATALAGGKNPTVTCRMTTNSTPSRIEDWTVELRIEDQ